jgi:hypothetical protein
MTACQRFEAEGLVRFVAGEPLDPHFDSCPDCRAARASYQAVALALEQARDAYTPPGDWEAKVWRKIQLGAVARRRPRWPALLGFGATVAAMAVFLVTSMGGPEMLALSTNEVERGSALLVRGATGGSNVRSAAPGNVWRLAIKVPRGKLGDLRVYRGANELVFQCATSPACIRSKDGMEARVTLEKPGTYRALYMAADKQVPASGNLDADYAAAMRAGGAASESLPIEVL